MSSPTPKSPVRRLVEAYDPTFRGRMTVPPESVDDPVALAAAAEALPPAARDLLDLALLVGPAGDVLPERLRPLIEAAGEALWLAALLLPRTSVPSPGASLLPTHYAAACRLNPAVAGQRPALLGRSEVTVVPEEAARATFPPSDARWDATLVAAWIEANPVVLRDDGLVRRDVERRMFAALGGESERWALALRLARVLGLVRAEGGKLRGFPEANTRSLADPAVLFESPAQAAASTLLLRLVGEAWVDVPGLLHALERHARECLFSPRMGAYADGRRFDAAGWEAVEAPLLLGALDVLHRAGWVEAHRDGRGIRAARRAVARPRHDEGFLLTPDGEILVHVGALSSPDLGRLARMAPFLDGERLCRHRLTREGVGADLAAGHSDAVAFLAGHSRTGVPPAVADSIREWQRSASRLLILTGADVEEDDEGRLRLALRPPEGPHKVIDYVPAPRARFLYQRGRIEIPTGWDPLTVRAAVRRIARPVEGTPEARVYVPERRENRDVADLLDRLRSFHGGELPGEVETIVLAGGGLAPVRAEPAVLVSLPGAAAAAVRRDWVAGPLLSRWVSQDQAVVAAADVGVLRERLLQLGLSWEG